MWSTGKTRALPSSSSATPVELYLSLAIAALACILRPTNIIIWLTVSMALLLRRGGHNKIIASSQAALLSGGAILAISVSADKLFYQDWVLPPLRFLQFNLVQSLAVFYGKNRPDYYLTEGLPLLLTTALPFAAIGLWNALRPSRSDRRSGASVQEQMTSVLALTVVSSVVTLSMISHKEMRFIYPLLPALHILAAEPLAKFFTPFPWSTKTYRMVLLLLLVSANACIAWYTLFVHQRGVIDVMHYLRNQHVRPDPALQALRAEGTASPGISVGFLMPCHSTPWMSHFIYPEIDAWALTCEPPLNLSLAERESYMDEADIFYAAPAVWIHDNMPPKPTSRAQHNVSVDDSHRRAWPDYLVFFEQLEETMTAILGPGHYNESWRGFNTHWHDDWRRRGDVIVWRRQR